MIVSLNREIQQSLAADGAIACFSNNLFPISLNAERAPQLKANVRQLGAFDEDNLPQVYLCALFCVYSVKLSCESTR